MTNEEARRQALEAIAEIQRRHAEEARIEAAPFIRILEMIPLPQRILTVEELLT